MASQPAVDLLYSDDGSSDVQTPLAASPPGPEQPAAAAGARAFLLHVTGEKILQRPKVSLSALGVVALVSLGAVAYHVFEGLSWIDSIYLSVSVVTTVGLVIVPRTGAGRIFTALLNASSLGLGVLLLVEIADWRRERWRGRIKAIVLAAGGASSPVFSSRALDAAALFAAAAPAVLGTAALLQWLEGWPWYAEAVYVCFTAATGLGLGDLEPTRPVSRLVFAAYLLWAMGATLHLLGLAGTGLHEAMRGVASGGGVQQHSCGGTGGGGGGGGAASLEPQSHGHAAGGRGGKVHRPSLATVTVR